VSQVHRGRTPLDQNQALISEYDINGYGRRVRDFLRGVVRLHVLHHAAKEELHGAWMAEELARHGHQISPGTLYPTLHRMEAEGLLVSRHQVVDGRRRRLYRATATGTMHLAEMRRALRELAEEVLQ